MQWKNVVYKITDKQGNIFCFKIFLNKHIDCVDRFNKELEINHSLFKSGIYVPKVLKYGTLKNKDMYIIYDFLEYQTLKQLLLKDKAQGLIYFQNIINNTFRFNSFCVPDIVENKKYNLNNVSLLGHNLTGEHVSTYLNSPRFFGALLICEEMKLAKLSLADLRMAIRNKKTN